MVFTPVRMQCFLFQSVPPVWVSSNITLASYFQSLTQGRAQCLVLWVAILFYLILYCVFMLLIYIYICICICLHAVVCMCVCKCSRVCACRPELNVSVLFHCFCFTIWECLSLKITTSLWGIGWSVCQYCVCRHSLLNLACHVGTGSQSSGL